MFQIAEVRDDEMTEKPGRKALFTGGPGKKTGKDFENEISESVATIVTYLEQQNRNKKLESNLINPLLQPLVNVINVFVEEMERTIGLFRMSEELFLKNPVPMVLQDNNSRIHTLNDAYAGLMDSTTDELREEGIKHCSIETESGDDPSSIYQGKNRAIAELKIIYEDGREKFVQLEAVPLSKGVESQTLGLFVFHDHSQVRFLDSRVKLLERERDSALFDFQTYVRESPVPMVIVDSELQIIEGNNEFKKLTSPDYDFSGKNIYSVPPFNNIQGQHSISKPIRREVRLKFNGEEESFSEIIVPIVNENNELQRSVIYYHKIIRDEKDTRIYEERIAMLALQNRKLITDKREEIAKLSIENDALKIRYNEEINEKEHDLQNLTRHVEEVKIKTETRIIELEQKLKNQENESEIKINELSIALSERKSQLEEQSLKLIELSEEKKALKTRIDEISEIPQIQIHYEEEENQKLRLELAGKESDIRELRQLLNEIKTSPNKPAIQTLSENTYESVQEISVSPDKVKENEIKTKNIRDLSLKDSTLDVVEFEIGGDKYAIDVFMAREIVEMMAITPIPGAPSYLYGIINLRGEITNIININTILGIPDIHEGIQKKIIVLSHEATDGENLGVIVDEVNSVNAIKTSQIEELGDSFEKISSQAYIQGIIMMDDKDLSKEEKKKEKDLVIFLNMHGLIMGLSKFQ